MIFLSHVFSFRRHFANTTICLFEFFNMLMASRSFVQHCLFSHSIMWWQNMSPMIWLWSLFFNLMNDCNIDINHLSLASIVSAVIHAHFMEVLSPGEVFLHEMVSLWIIASGWVLSFHLLILASSIVRLRTSVTTEALRRFSLASCRHSVLGTI
jgi:hypothetical protein